MNTPGPYQKLISVYEVVSPNDLVITIDDNVIYQREWLAKVVTAAERYPNAVICGRARVISQNVLGRWKSYHRWPYVHHITYAFWILPVGCAGIAYRKSLLCEAFLRDRQCLPMASVNEDLWFRTASLLEGAYVYVDPKLNTGNIVLSNNELPIKAVPSLKSQSRLKRAWLAVKLSALGYFGAEIGKSDKAWRTVNQYLLHYCAMSDPFRDDIDEGRDRRIVKKKYPSRIK
nr:glycosyltransferase [Halomonas cerina]